MTVPASLARPLREITTEIAHDDRRVALYADLAAHRDRQEPTLRAFEARREVCPDLAAAPLNGLPITVKDQIAVAGWPRGFGLERPPRHRDAASAAVVARLQALGAVVTGKTALPPNALDFQTYNRRRGFTGNPHDPQVTAGGSSGGGAAAVASGMSLLDVGADLAGSLRLPAGWCGVSSLTPTEGALSGDGMLQGSQSLDHFARIGFIAQRARDLSFVWSLLQPRSTPIHAMQDAPRIAVWAPEGHPSCDADTHAAWTSVPTQLSQAGLGVDPDPMTWLLAPDMYRLAGEIIGYETGALIPAPIRWLMRRDHGAARRSPGFVAHIHDGYRRDRARYAQNLDLLQMVRSQALARCGHMDALILPVTGICAFRHIKPMRDRSGVRDYDQQFATLAGPLPYFDALTRFTLPLTLLGWPVVTIPLGRDRNGIPIGAQIVGKPHTEPALLGLAETLACVFDAD